MEADETRRAAAVVAQHREGSQAGNNDAQMEMTEQNQNQNPIVRCDSRIVHPAPENEPPPNQDGSPPSKRVCRDVVLPSEHRCANAVPAPENEPPPNQDGSPPSKRVCRDVVLPSEHRCANAVPAPENELPPNQDGSPPSKRVCRDVVLPSEDRCANAVPQTEHEPLRECKNEENQANLAAEYKRRLRVRMNLLFQWYGEDVPQYTDSESLDDDDDDDNDDDVKPLD